MITGKKNGLAINLYKKISNLFTWHYLCHRPELSVHGVVKGCTGVSHFQRTMDKCYAYYHHSLENPRGLDESSVEVSIEIKKIGCILNARWFATSFRSIKAI